MLQSLCNRSLSPFLFLAEQQTEEQRRARRGFEEQDQAIDMLGDVMARLRVKAEDMNAELGDQNRRLEDW